MEGDYSSLEQIMKLRLAIIEEIGQHLGEEENVYNLVYIMVKGGVLPEEDATEFFSAYNELISKYKAYKEKSIELDKAVEEGSIEKFLKAYVESDKLLAELNLAYNRYMEEREILVDKLDRYESK